MDKVFVQVVVPMIQEKYDILIPNNKRLCNVVILLQKALNDFTGGWYPVGINVSLYNQVTGKKYDLNKTVWEENIGSGTRLIII